MPRREPARPTQRRRTPTRAHAGFTLLDVSFALLVVMIALLGLMASLSHAIRLDLNVQETTVALHATRSLLEVLQSMPFDQLAGMNGAGFPADRSHTAAGDRLTPPEGRTHVLGVGVHPVSPGDPELLEIVVRAEWRGSLGARTLELRTLVAGP